jgi:hypothetical protein
VHQDETFRPRYLWPQKRPSSGYLSSLAHQYRLEEKQKFLEMELIVDEMYLEPQETVQNESSSQCVATADQEVVEFDSTTEQDPSLPWPYDEWARRLDNGEDIFDFGSEAWNIPKQQYENQ